MYRKGLLILAIILIVIGAVLEWAVPISVVATLGHIMLIVGIITFVVWLVLLVVDYIRRGA